MQRIAGFSFIAGALIVIAANAAHPRGGDPRDYHAVIQMIADLRGGYWEAVHVFLAMGMWALAAGPPQSDRSISRCVDRSSMARASST